MQLILYVLSEISNDALYKLTNRYDAKTQAIGINININLWAPLAATINTRNQTRANIFVSGISCILIKSSLLL